VAVIAPDAGAEKRAGAVAYRLGLPMLHGWKTRDVHDGRISGFGLERATLAPGRVLVVDDICDGGGTFIGLGEVIAKRKLQPDLFVSHGLFTKGTAKLREFYGRIMTTDSIDGAHECVDVVPVATHLFERE